MQVDGPKTSRKALIHLKSSAALLGAAEWMLLYLGGIITFLGLWYLCSFAIGEYFPPPHLVGEAIVNNLTSSRYFSSIGLPSGGYGPHLVATTKTVVGGVLVGVCCGCLTGFASAYSAYIKKVLAPVVWLFGASPIMVVAPFALIWFGVSAASKIVLISLYTAVTIHVFALQASETANARLVEFARTQGASRFFCVVNVSLPAAVPQVFGGIRIALAAAWGLAAITELLGSVEGIGRVIIATWGMYDLASMMGGVALIGLLAVFLDALVVFARSRIVHWT